MGFSSGQNGEPMPGLFPGNNTPAANFFTGNQGTGKGSGGIGTPQQANPAISPYIMQLLQARLGQMGMGGQQPLSQGLFSGGQSPGMIAQRQQEAQVQQQIAQRQQQAAATQSLANKIKTPPLGFQEWADANVNPASYRNGNMGAMDAYQNYLAQQNTGR